jgi:hypothetical protein
MGAHKRKAKRFEQKNMHTAVDAIEGVLVALGQALDAVLLSSQKGRKSMEGLHARTVELFEDNYRKMIALEESEVNNPSNHTNPTNPTDHTKSSTLTNPYTP